MADIDTLEIKIQVEFEKAEKAINNVISKLSTLNKSISSINSSGLKDLSVGVDTLFNSVKGASQVDGRSISAVARNINKFAKIDNGRLASIANSLNQLNSGLSVLGASNNSLSGIHNLASAISKLGSAKVEKAISNLPKLTNNLRQAMSVLATSPKVSNNLIKMTNALANLANQGQKVGTVSRSLNSNFNSYNTSVSRSTKKTLSFASAIGKFYATYFLLIRGIKSMWKSVQSSMDYVETYNYFNVATNKVGEQFKDQFDKFEYEDAKTYSKSFRDRLNELTTKMTGYSIGENGELSSTGDKSLGLDPAQLMEFQAKTMGVTNSVGLMGEASVATSKALSMLSADLSSLTNTDLETVMTNLSSGLIGQSRALYKYGIDITSATLQTTAYANGITKAVSQMTQAEKMQLRILDILNQSKIAWGDQANTINSVANSYRVMQQQLSNTGRVLGNLFLPIVKSVLPVINGLIIAIGRLGEQLGMKLWGDNWQSGLNDNVGDIASIDYSIEELGEDIDGVGASAKKLKNQLRGFDELNVINTQTSSGSGSSVGGGFDLSEQIKLQLGEYESVWEQAFKNMENLSQEFANKFEILFDPVSSIIDKLKEGDFEGAGEEVSGLIVKGLEKIQEKLEDVDWQGIGNKIGGFLKGLDWSKIMYEVGKTIVAALKGAVELWIGSFEKDPIKTLTLTIGLLAFKFGAMSFLTGSGKSSKGIGEALTGSFLSKKIAEKIGLKHLGLFSFGVTFLLTAGWLIKEQLNDPDSDIRKATDGVYDDFVEKGAITKEEADSAKNYLTNMNWSDTIKNNLKEIKKGWTELFNFGDKEHIYNKYGREASGSYLEGAEIKIKEYSPQFKNNTVKSMTLGETESKELYVNGNNLSKNFNLGATKGLSDLSPQIKTLAKNSFTPTNEENTNIESSGTSLSNKFVLGITNFLGKNAPFINKVAFASGQTLTVGYQQGIDSENRSITNSVTGITNSTKNTFTNNLGIGKSNSVSYGYGKKTIQEFTNGLKQTEGTLKGQLNSTSNTFVSTFSTLNSKSNTQFNTMSENIKRHSNNMNSNLTGSFTSASGNVTKSIEAMNVNTKGTLGLFYNSIIDIANKVKNAFNFDLKLPNIKLPKFSFNAGEAPYGVGGKGSLPSFNISWYKNGGFLPNSYTLFGAGENGVPEMLGTVGGKSAVASGAEITGISDAVYTTGNAQTELLNLAVGLLQVIADKPSGITKDQIFNSFRESATEFTRRTGNPAIPI